MIGQKLEEEIELQNFSVIRQKIASKSMILISKMSHVEQSTLQVTVLEEVGRSECLAVEEKKTPRNPEKLSVIVCRH